MNKQQLLLQERFSEKIKFSEEYLNKSVSYTHLTLPTKA